VVIGLSMEERILKSMTKEEDRGEEAVSSCLCDQCDSVALMLHQQCSLPL